MNSFRILCFYLILKVREKKTTNKLKNQLFLQNSKFLFKHILKIKPPTQTLKLFCISELELRTIESSMTKKKR